MNDLLNNVAWRWLPFGLLPSDRSAGRSFPEMHELRLPAGETDWLAAMQADTVETVLRRPIDDVLKHFTMRAVMNHYAAGEFAAGRRPRQTSLTELQQWIDHTRSLADRLPVAGPWKDQMHAVASALVHMLDWPAQFFDRWPANEFETQRHADWRVSLNLWALNELLRAVNESEPLYANWQAHETGIEQDYLKIPPTKWWPAMFDWVPRDRVDLEFDDYNVAQKRVQRLDHTIKTGMRNPLMVALLAEAMHSPSISAPAPPTYAPNVH